tara:strand:+ start:1795 stop:2520 length:726 start_codon:yes stop_codon:yes gene_type:complete
MFKTINSDLDLIEINSIKSNEELEINNENESYYNDNEIEFSNRNKDNLIKLKSVDSLFNTNLTIYQKMLINDYLDKSFIMGILCENAKNYYYNLKIFLHLPIVLISSILCIFNSASGSIPEKSHYILTIINIISNAIIAIFISLQSLYQIHDKYNQFQQITNKFTKLEHYIETYITNEPTKVNELFINDLIKTYDTIIEDIDFTFPEFIKKKIKLKYKDIRTMPNILNGDKKPILLDDILK